MDINTRGIKVFLDNVDLVLNSNTFLLDFDILENDIETSFKTFLESDSFIQKLMEQDRLRNWFMFHVFDLMKNDYIPKIGNIRESDFKLK